MKAAALEYASPRTLDDALKLLAQHPDEAKILAGGQSLIPAMNMRLATPSLLVDIGRIPELSAITLKNGVLRLGATVRQREIETSEQIARHAPLLAMAAPHVAHAAVRNRGTIGGSLAHADPASEMPACMLALGARFNIVGPRGPRTVAAEAFFRGLYETDLKQDEILVSVDIPAMPAGARVAFDELVRRHGDYAMVGIAAVGRSDAGALQSARFVFFAVADRPVLAAATSKAVEGKSGEPAIKAALAALDGELDPAGDLHTSGATKKHLARVLLGRAINQLTRQPGAR